jgi:hypothetical protein
VSACGVDGHVSRDRPILEGIRPIKSKRPGGLAWGCMVLAPGKGHQASDSCHPETEQHDRLEHAGDPFTPGRGVVCSSGRSGSWMRGLLGGSDEQDIFLQPFADRLFRCSGRLFSKIHRKSFDLSDLRPVNRMASLPP